MENLYLVQSAEELSRYQAFTARVQRKIEDYAAYLCAHCAVQKLPRCIVWTSGETASSRISDIPVPAYTNEYRVVLTPEVDVWRRRYLAQIEGQNWREEELSRVSAVRAYYQTTLTEDNVLQILGHELAHHSEYFEEAFDDEDGRECGIWFEEGMAEYISRRWFLTDEAFEAQTRANRTLVELLRPRLGARSLEAFGQGTYAGNYTGIFYEYWRSFLAVQTLVERLGSVEAVFAACVRWTKVRQGTLEEWFEL